jgi:spoIIIJ-associated protein
VEIVILKKGKSGLLGLGAEEARVRVTPLPSSSSIESQVSEIAKEVMEKLLEGMKVAARVEVKPAAEEGGSGGIILELRGEDVGILIGRQGQTLASLQHILRLIVAHRLKARVPISIDVEGYKQRHYQALRRLALRLAEKVKATGQSVTLEPMPANERRIVHLALAEHPDVITQSVGDGDSRKVIIVPKK